MHYAQSILHQEAFSPPRPGTLRLMHISSVYSSADVTKPRKEDEDGVSKSIGQVGLV